MRSRVDGLTMSQHLYGHLREARASVSPHEVAEAFGIAYGAAAKRLQHAVATGWLSRRLVRIGSHWVTFYGLVEGRRPRPDGRGRDPASQANGGFHGHPNSLANLKYHAGTHPRPYVRRLHPLEKAWR